MVHALGQVLSLLLYLWHLLCLVFLWVGPGLLLLYCYLHFLLRSCMMRLYKYVIGASGEMAHDDRDCMQCIWTHLALLDRIDVKLLLGSQHHLKTRTTSTCYLLHSLLLPTPQPPLISANYHIALTSATTIHQHNYTSMPSHTSKPTCFKDTPKCTK
jgi:hypothetical protein